MATSCLCILSQYIGKRLKHLHLLHIVVNTVVIDAFQYIVASLLMDKCELADMLLQRHLYSHLSPHQVIWSPLQSVLPFVRHARSQSYLPSLPETSQHHNIIRENRFTYVNRPAVGWNTRRQTHMNPSKSIRSVLIHTLFSDNARKLCFSESRTSTFTTVVWNKALRYRFWFTHIFRLLLHE